MTNYKITLAYDGSRYSGWQKQGNTQNTIQGKLEKVLSAMFGCPIEAQGSGRTDAGVHAAAQVASFHADTGATPEAVCRYLRAYLPQDIGVLSVETADERFHARLSATGKTYRYRVWNTEVPNVFERKYLYVLPERLDAAAMEACLPYFLGEHDFRAFCSNPELKKSSVRTITEMKLERLGPELRLTVSGSGFLYNMVRLMMGTMLEVGRGKRKPGEIPAILESGDRRLSGPMAPACGLCMMEVRYD
ncbi:MAG: tRNA pseudouridine(38-40) synthase TruA [Oscillospiraceae bacterium]|nr:tRNA pseudouridine(38-40) synthase TruA [Oscillospiraceae bacterium]